MTMRHIGMGWLVIGAIAMGCDDGDDPAVEAPIELVGSWSSAFGDETISETRWNGFCEQAITRWDNDTNVAVLETLSGDGCGTGFARYVWLEPADDQFYYCVTAFGAETADMAAGAPEQGVDRTDTAAGCAGFGWSHLTRR